MERFIFNRDFFDNQFISKDEKQYKKINVICKKVHWAEETCKSKLLSEKSSSKYRSISEVDYNLLKEIDIRFVLDTEKLIGKLFLRVNLDLSPNQKYVLYLMLCLLNDDGEKYVSIDDLKRKANDEKFKQELTEKILKECMITIDNKGKTDNLYIAENGKYSINLSALILFTEYE